MTEPSAARPVPGPPRPSGGSAVGTPPGAAPLHSAPPVGGPAPGSRAPETAPGPFAELDGRPVAEHVVVFEAEHDRLQRELGTIDQL